MQYTLCLMYKERQVVDCRDIVLITVFCQFLAISAQDLFKTPHFVHLVEKNEMFCVLSTKIEIIVGILRFARAPKTLSEGTKIPEGIRVL